MSDRWHNNNMQQNPANERLDTVKSPFVESPMAIDKAMIILGKSSIHSVKPFGIFPTMDSECVRQLLFRAACQIKYAFQDSIIIWLLFHSTLTDLNVKIVKKNL